MPIVFFISLFLFCLTSFPFKRPFKLLLITYLINNYAEIKLSKYIITARRKGSDWYVGGQTNWSGYELDLPLNFLDSNSSYTAKLFCDGKNSNKNGCDYKIKEFEVDKTTNLPITMSSGGGFVLIIKKK